MTDQPEAPMSDERLSELQEGFRRCELHARFRPSGKPQGDTAVVGECLREIHRLKMQLAGAAETFEAFMPPEEAAVIREELKKLRIAVERLTNELKSRDSLDEELYDLLGRAKDNVQRRISTAGHLVRKLDEEQEMNDG